MRVLHRLIVATAMLMPASAVWIPTSSAWGQDAPPTVPAAPPSAEPSTQPAAATDESVPPPIAEFEVKPQAPSATENTVSGQMLASELMRLALIRVCVDPLTLEAIEAATLLTNEAISLDPDNPELWRHTLDLALLAEDDELKTRALERLNKLDPADEVVRLMRLNAALERHQTAEARIDASLRLLEAANIAKLGPAVSSRLALDLALLYQRLDDTPRFTHWLKKSLELDSSNRSAAAIAAGFFRMNVEDPVGEVELLVNLMLADPTDLTIQVALAQLLLENGAYQGADRIYTVAVRGFNKSRNFPSNNLVADAAVAQWARGRDREATEMIRKRFTEWDNQVRAEAMQNDRTLDTPRLAAISAPLDPVLATVNAAIEVGRSSPDAEAAVNKAIAAYEQRIKLYLEEGPKGNPPATPEQINAAIAPLHLEMAWIALWLGNNVDKATANIAAAEKLQPISDTAKVRFDGWIALANKDTARAIELLRPVAADDIAARSGLALALLQTGDTKAAAREFLAVNRAQPGSLLGIWAAQQLHALLKTRVALSDTAVAMEQVIGSIPASFDRYPDDGTLAVSLRIKPAQANFGSYEPVRLEFELYNNSVYPLAIDRDGPIRPQIYVAIKIRTPNIPQLDEVRPFIVNIGRRLRLAPQEKIIVPMDLRLQPAAEVLNALALDGAIIKLTAVVNFSINQGGSVNPGLYGCEIEAPLIRVDGQRVGEDWINAVTQMLQKPNDPDTVRQMALLSNRIAPRITDDATLKVRRTIENARVAFDAAYQQLNPRAQAWMLCVMPSGAGTATEGLAATRQSARQSKDRHVLMAYLMYHSSGNDDPMFDAAKRSEDPVLRRLAELIQTDNLRMERRQQAEAEYQQQQQQQQPQPGAAPPR